MLDRSELAIVIPAFNEAATIAQVVNAVLPYGNPIVIDDCSSDETGTLAHAAGAMVVKHSVNQGYEGSLNSGFAAAERQGYAYVLTFDADGQHNPVLIEEFYTHLKQGHDLVVGVRPNYARLGERIFAAYTRLRFGLKDPLCGMKGFKMDLYRERGWFDSYQSVNTELALYGLSKKKALKQIPISIAPRHGAPRFGQSWKANYRILRAMFLSLLRV